MNNISIFWYIKLFDQYSSSLYLSMFFFLFFFTFYVYRIYIFISDLSNNNILWCVHANSPTPTTVQLQDLYHSLNSHNVMIVMTPRFYFIIMHYTSFVLLFSASITTTAGQIDKNARRERDKFITNQRMWHINTKNCKK